MRFCFTIVITLLATLVATADAATVRLRTTATVSDNIVRLGDVADVSASDADSAWRLEHASLMPAPRVGAKVRLSMEFIQRRLAAHRFTAATIDFLGSSVVLIERTAPATSTAGQSAQPLALASFNVARESKAAEDAKSSRRPAWKLHSTQERRAAEEIVRRIVSDYLVRNAPEWGNPTIQPELISYDVGPIVETGPQLVIQSGELITDGLYRIGLRDAEDTGSESVVTVRVRITLKPRVWGAHQTLSDGDVITKNDLVLVEAEHKDNGTTEADDLIGMQVRKTVGTGDPILLSNVEPAILVKRSDIVEVQAVVGGIRLTKYFKAQRNGVKGDMIPLEDLDDRGVTITARVTGQRTADASRPAPRPTVSNR